MVPPLPASNRLIHCAELLDLIFEQVDKKTLLLSLTNVNHHFKSHIESSTVLQAKLFLHAPRSTIIDNHWKRKTEHSEIAHVKLNGFIYNVKASSLDYAVGQDSKVSMIDFLPKPHELTLPLDTPVWWRNDAIIFLPYVPQSLKKMHGTTAPTWRDMFLTKPPVTTVRLLHPSKLSFKEESRFSANQMNLHNSDGVKISDVLDWITGFADSEFLQMAPYAVQLAFKTDMKVYKRYITLLARHFADWGPVHLHRKQVCWG